MPDSPLLRLARIVAHTAKIGGTSDDYHDAAELVRDLEAAPKVQAPRTITRKQYEMAVGRISSSRDELSASVCALICLREWRLTVEG